MSIDIMYVNFEADLAAYIDTVKHAVKAETELEMTGTASEWEHACNRSDKAVRRALKAGATVEQLTELTDATKFYIMQIQEGL